MRTPACLVRVDPGASLGPVKPVNGVGQPPMVGALGSWSMMHFLKEAGIPFSRLHDVGGWLGGGLYVDIPNVFPDFSADENDPASYRFAYTDSLVSALVENGVEPFFRLGVTIENWVANGFPPLRSLPPPDFAKWARVSERIVRHYTEGWAAGFRHAISHWEIWNEPDSRENPDENEMWRGSFADYCRFYEVASKHLKAAFPHLKIGGYAGCGVGMAFWKDPSARGEHHLRCFHEFLRFARERGCPLDFFSFHSYSGLCDLKLQIGYVREYLDKAGFAGVETCLDEWLPEPSRAKLGTAAQASEIAAALLTFQNGPLDAAAIYDARCGVGSYSPLFNPLSCEPHKAYWAFVAFNELRKAGTAIDIRECGAPRSPSRQDDGRDNPAVSSEMRVLCDGPCPVAFSAARGADGSLAVMLATPGEEEVPVTLEIAGTGRPAAAKRCRIVDGARTWELCPMPCAMPPHSFLLAEF